MQIGKTGREEKDMQQDRIYRMIDDLKTFRQSSLKSLCSCAFVLVDVFAEAHQIASEVSVGNQHCDFFRCETEVLFRCNFDLLSVA